MVNGGSVTAVRHPVRVRMGVRVRATHTSQSMTLRLFGVLCLATAICGLSAQPSARIVGGTSAATNAAPYIVSLQVNSVHYCAGSILNEHWVVTAAHCLTSSTQVMSSVLVAGSNNVNGAATTVQKLAISYYLMHDLYTGGTAPYDIGLVYTSTAFTWTAAVAAVTLPTSGVIPSGTATMYGWGSTSTTSVAAYPTQLQVATVPIIELTTCVTALGSKGTDVHSTNLCTGPLTGGVGICTSDSGGPLVQTSTAAKTVLIGIVSWGKIPCGQANSPSVFVQVSDFVTWIASNQVIPKGLK